MLYAFEPKILPGKSRLKTGKSSVASPHIIGMRTFAIKKRARLLAGRRVPRTRPVNDKDQKRRGWPTYLSDRHSADQGPFW